MPKVKEKIRNAPGLGTMVKKSFQNLGANLRQTNELARDNGGFVPRDGGTVSMESLNPPDSTLDSRTFSTPVAGNYPPFNTPASPPTSPDVVPPPVAVPPRTVVAPPAAAVPPPTMVAPPAAAVPPPTMVDQPAAGRTVLTDAQKNEAQGLFGGTMQDSDTITFSDGTVVRRSDVGLQPAARTVAAPAQFDESPPSFEEIRQREMQRAQAVIDATEGLFQQNILDIQQRGLEAEMQQQAISTGAGLAASPFQTAQVGKVTEKTAQIERAEHARRSAEIAQIKAAAEGNADSRYESAVERYQADRDFFVDERDKLIAENKARLEANRVKATDSIKGYAQAGISLSELNQSELQGLLDDAEMSEFEAHALWSMNTPEAGGEVSVSNGMLVNTYFDPVTQKPVVKVRALPESLIAAADGMKYTAKEMKDGTLLMIPEEIDPSIPLDEQVVNFGKFLAPEEPEDPAKARQREVAQELMVESAQTKLDLIDKIIAHPGMNNVVGLMPWSRIELPLSAQEEDFMAQVKKLISQETLTALTNLKAKGGTLGAISQTELEMLKNSASAIEDWMGSEFGGVADDIKISEAAFLEEVSGMREIADKALKRAQGDLPPPEDAAVSDDEMELLREAFPDMSDEDIRASLQGQENEPFSQDLSKSGKLLGLGQITGYGSPLWEHGLDIDLKTGDSVPSPASGEVVFVGENGGFGNQVRIQTAQGNEIWLSHLDSANVNVGDRVRKGQAVALGGNTGSVIPMNGGDGSHLDLTVVKPDGSYMPPKEIARSLGLNA